jgi:hypothetical protein
VSQSNQKKNATSTVEQQQQQQKQGLLVTPSKKLAPAKVLLLNTLTKHNKLERESLTSPAGRRYQASHNWDLLEEDEEEQEQEGDVDVSNEYEEAPKQPRKRMKAKTKTKKLASKPIKTAATTTTTTTTIAVEEEAKQVSASPSLAATPVSVVEKVAVTETDGVSLNAQWDWLMFLLRPKLKTATELKQVMQEAFGCVTVFAEIQTAAAQSGQSTGAVCRKLLPFNNNTSVSDQADINLTASPAMAEIAAQLQLPIELCTSIVRQLVCVRKLVRVKIADVNDLAQAEESIHSVNTFFRGLQTQSEMTGKTLMDCFQIAKQPL